MIARHISALGDSVHTVANMLLVQTVTGSALAWGTVITVYTLPQILFSLIGGVSVDRYNRKKILIYSDILRALGVFSLALLSYFDILALWHITLVAAFNGAVGSFFSPAVSASVPQIVEKDDLQRANALNTMNVRVAGILGASLGGLVMGSLGAWGSYLFDAGTFFLSAFFIFSIQLPVIRVDHVPSHGMTGVWHDMKEGISFILSRRAVLALASLSVMVNMVALAVPVLLPSYYEESLQRTNALGYGFLWSSVTIGMFLGAFMLNALRNVSNKVLWIWGAAVWYGLATFMMALFSNYWVAIVCMIGMSFSLSVSILLSTTLYQTLVPNEFLGRFFANLSLFTLGLTPLITWIAGYGADQTSAKEVFIILGTLLLGFCMLWATQYGSIRCAMERLA